MIKTYTSNSKVSLNIKVGEAVRKISFMPMSNGTSQYTTSDEREIEALEKHYGYERIYTVFSIQEEEPVVEPVIEEEEKAEEKDEERTVVEVSGPDDAKEYLAMNYGVARSNLKSIKRIKEVAEENGVEFVGL